MATLLGRRSPIPLLLLLGLAACSATRLADVWQGPAPAEPLRQVAVFAFGPDEAAWRPTEDEFVLRLPARTRGVAGHGLVPVAEQGDFERVRARLRDGGFDGVLLVWIGGGDAGGLPTPRSFADAYQAAQAAAQRPGPAPGKGSARLETFLFALPSEERVWSASSRAFDPAEQREVTAGVARVVMERLQKAGLLVES